MSGAARNQRLIQMTKTVGTILLVPSLPVGAWYYTAIQDRKEREEQVRTRVRVPNVQTVDDLMVERCQPGDVVLFDRRCHKCANGPVAALSCLTAKGLLCDEADEGSGGGGRRVRRSVETGSFEHVGIIVPGHKTTKRTDTTDPTNLLLLEATPSKGIIARPLLTRLEMSQSRTVLLLPLSSPGERRTNDSNNNDHEPHPKTIRLRAHMAETLSKFRDEWTSESEKKNYASGHATLGILGALGYAMGLYRTSPAPVSPSAWVVVSALQRCGAAVHLSDRTGLECRVEDFLRDDRFARDGSEGTIRLRPGWKFDSPMVMRETSRS